jgi:hypothetical protein
MRVMAAIGIVCDKIYKIEEKEHNKKNTFQWENDTCDAAKEKQQIKA